MSASGLKATPYPLSDVSTQVLRITGFATTRTYPASNKLGNQGAVY
jgi:hypothetical protein